MKDLSCKKETQVMKDYQNLRNTGKLEAVAKAQNQLNREIIRICKESSQYPEELYALIKSKI